MHIIFGQAQAEELAEKYTVLELDTFQIGSAGPVVTAYCTLDAIPPGEMLSLDTNKKMHQQLIAEYKQKHWGRCLELLLQLQGKWNNEMESFYQDLRSRVEQNAVCDPGPTWTHIIIKD